MIVAVLEVAAPIPSRARASSTFSIRAAAAPAPRACGQSWSELPHASVQHAIARLPRAASASPTGVLGAVTKPRSVRRPAAQALDWPLVIMGRQASHPQG
jgi:hypothetical protein